MHERTQAICRLLALVMTVAIFVLAQPIRDGFIGKINADIVLTPTAHASGKEDQHTPVPSSSVPAPVAESAPKEEEKPATPAPAPEPPKPAAWSIANPPVGTAEWVNKAIAHYQSMGLTKQGVAMLIGNFMQEKGSAFSTGDPCGGVLGDGGAAHGFGQWHPGRRADMPCGFTEQLTWAVDVEMVRDNAKGGGHGLSALVRDPNATPAQLDLGLKKWERYGHKGLRYEYGIKILSQL